MGQLISPIVGAGQAFLRLGRGVNSKVILSTLPCLLEFPVHNDEVSRDGVEKPTSSMDRKVL